MSKYWVIAPYDSQPEAVFNVIWQYDMQHNVIGIGWHEAGNIFTQNEAQWKVALTAVFGEKANISHITSTFHKFYHEIEIGDIIVARRGRKQIVGVGTVTQRAFYDKQMGEDMIVGLPTTAYPCPNFLGVQWINPAVERSFDFIRFGMRTLESITEDKYNDITQIVEEISENEDDQGNVNISPENYEIVLEKYLQEFIVSNFATIFKGNLEIYRDPDDGTIGQQLKTEAGILDILAVDKLDNAYVVIELKKGKTSDVVIGQTLRYMGWVKDNLCLAGEDVRGLIIAKDQDQNLAFALKMVPSIDIRFYKVSFQLGNNP